MRNFLFLIGAALSFILTGASNAAQIVSPSAAAAAPPGAAPASPAGDGHVPRVSQVAATGAPILLEAGKGTLIRLDRQAATVFIANPDVADVQVKSPLLIYISAKSPGETVLYAVDSDDNVLLNSPVRVEQDLTRVRQSLHVLVPGENVSVKSVDNSLVLSGEVSTAGRAEKVRNLASAIAGETKGQVVNQMSIATPNQVNLRVKIVEVSRQVLKSLGINWNAATNRFQFVTDNPVVGNGITNENLFSYTFPAAGGAFQATLDALAQENLVTTLAEPNLTTTSGQPASFLAGGEFPIPVAVAPATGTTGSTITVAFKTYGVQLAFTPTIIDAEHLSLRVRPEVSELTNVGAVTISGFTIPALLTRSADTTVELASGQSFALGGLLQNNSIQNVSKVPGLGDIPILGQLFRSDQFQRNESELVIIVTPYLVRPTETALATPMDGYVAPHDIERVINSSTYRESLPAPAAISTGSSPAGLIGPVGFRLD